MKNYNFDFAMSADISAAVVKEMIKNAVESQTGKRVTDVVVNTRTVTRGMGMAEHDETEFSGVKVFFESEKAKQSSGKKVFTETTYNPHAR